MARASLGAAYAYVREGFRTLVEIDVSDPWRRAVSEEIFSDVGTLFILLTVRREIAMERLRTRGTEPCWLGWFMESHERFEGRSFRNTMQIDTSDISPEVVAAKIVQLVESAS